VEDAAEFTEEDREFELNGQHSALILKEANSEKNTGMNQREKGSATTH